MPRELTPTSDFYVDASRLDLEHRDVFGRSWQLVGHADQLAQHGDYFTAMIGREPLVLTNDRGTLRGFYNVCRHRAGPVAVGCGRASRLVCRYHGWTYDLSGQLLRTTEMAGSAAFDPGSIQLQSVQVHRFGPMILASLDPRLSRFDEYHPGLAERCAPLQLERMKHVTTREYHVNANWKVYVDNYLEGYHIPLVHPNLNRELDYREYVTELGARHVLQYAPVKQGSAYYQQGAGDGQAYYYWLFPNIMLNIYEGQLQTNVVIPLSVDRTLVRFDWYAPEPIPDPQSNARWRELAHFSEEIQAEDAAICEAVQRNLGSRAYVPGPYSEKREAGVRLFHELMYAS